MLGAPSVLGGVAYIAATIREPGVIAHTGTMANLRVGAFPGGRTERATEFAAAVPRRRHRHRGLTGYSARVVGEVLLPVGVFGMHVRSRGSRSACARRSRLACDVRGRHSRGLERRPRDGRAAVGRLCGEAVGRRRRASRRDEGFDAARSDGRPSPRGAVAVRERWSASPVRRASRRRSAARSMRRVKPYSTARHADARIRKRSDRMRLLLHWLINALALLRCRTSSRRSPSIRSSPR